MKSAEVVELFSRRGKNRSRDELAFLPAALEIVETPPSPVGRAVGATVVLLFCVALAWTAFGTIDIVSSAPGKIVPSDRVKVIQPLEIGVVRALFVEDGQRVKAGDLLLEIDSTINEAESRMLQSDLIATRLDIARLRAAVSDEADATTAFKPPAEATADQISQQKRFLVSQVGEYRAKLGSLDRQREQKEAEAGTTAAQVAKLEAMLPVMQQRYEIRRTLHNADLGSKLQYLEALQSLTEMQQDILVQRNQLKVAKAAVAGIVEARAQAEAEFKRGVFDELGKLSQKENQLAENLIKAEKKAKLQQLRTPVDGTVQQLAVHTVGGVVTPSQELLVIVPTGNRLEVEAMVTNRDIGFIQAGQEAEIKIDTFNFTKYGLIRGEVTSISQDAIKRQKAPEKPNTSLLGTDTGSSEPAGQELVYAARIHLDRTSMDIEGKTVDLTPGMAVTAEIKTGSRTVLSYLLSPLVRFRDESMRER